MTDPAIERVAAVIPAHNAAATLAAVVVGVRNHIETVFVVDDGSTDQTAEVARAAGAIVLRHEVNRGKGAALKTAFAEALSRGFEGIVTIDADGQHLPSEIPRILAARASSGADLVVGGRMHLFEQMRPARRLANRLSTWAIGRVSRTGVSDSQSGFRFYSARLLRAVELHSDRFDMESEVLVRAGLAGFPVIVAPVDLAVVDGLSTSHYRPLADSLRIAWTVFRVRFLRR